jgi:hypothetical protein
VPIARLAAAQATIEFPREEITSTIIKKKERKSALVY